MGCGSSSDAAGAHQTPEGKLIRAVFLGENVAAIEAAFQAAKACALFGEAFLNSPS